jgi:ribosomal-protein-alanine N-acetyltransferase
VSAWSIVALDESHIDGIVSIEKESFRQPWQRISFSNELACNDAIDVVVPNPGHGQIIAYACLRLTLENLHLLRVAVAPKWRRQGLAERLLSSCIREARVRGAKAAYLEVRQSNKSATNLYLKLGFRIVATRPKYYMDTEEDALIMMKVLEEAQ